MKKYILILISSLLLAYGTAYAFNLGVIGGGAGAGGVTEGIIGTTTYSSTDFFTIDYVYFSEFTVTQAGTVGYAHVRVSDGGGATMCVSLHENDSSPYDWLVVGEGTLSDNSDQWENIQLDNTYEISAGTYLLAVQVSNNIQMYRDTTGSGYIWSDDSFSYDCATTATDIQKDATKSTGPVISIIFNNTAGDPS